MFQTEQPNQIFVKVKNAPQPDTQQPSKTHIRLMHRSAALLHRDKLSHDVASTQAVAMTTTPLREGQTDRERKTDGSLTQKKS